jgi:hypothetical protein
VSQSTWGMLAGVLVLFLGIGVGFVMGSLAQRLLVMRRAINEAATSMLEFKQWFDAMLSDSTPTEVEFTPEPKGDSGRKYQN